MVMIIIMVFIKAKKVGYNRILADGTFEETGSWTSDPTLCPECYSEMN